MNKKIIPVYISVCIVIVGFLIFKPDQKITNYPSSGDMVVAFGDSLMEGVGASSGKDFVSSLSSKVGKPIINLGISGNTTLQGLSRVDRVAIYKPKVVLVLLGGNDYLQKIPKNETFKNLEDIITKIQSTGAVVVLLGIQGGILGDPYEKEFEILAKRKGTVYVPNVLDGILGNSKFMSDAIHPNDAGYEKISEKIYPYLKKILE